MRVGSAKHNTWKDSVMLSAAAVPVARIGRPEVLEHTNEWGVSKTMEYLHTSFLSSGAEELAIWKYPRTALHAKCPGILQPVSLGQRQGSVRTTCVRDVPRARPLCHGMNPAAYG
jgi:hypothetical protein